MPASSFLNLRAGEIICVSVDKSRPRIKSYLRNSSRQGRVSSGSLSAIENNLVRKMSQRFRFFNIIDEVAKKLRGIQLR